MRDIINDNDSVVVVNPGEESSNNEKKNRRNQISNLDRVTHDLYLKLLTKMDVMREEETCLINEYEQNKREWIQFEDRFRKVAEGSKGEKMRLHQSEIEKMRLHQS